MGNIWIWVIMVLSGVLGAPPVWGQETLEVKNAPASISLLDALRVETNLTFCGEAVPLGPLTDRTEVRERLEKELLLILWDRPQVILWLKRAGRYFPVIEKQLADSGLPEDLKYIAVVESALRPHIGSPKGAVGFWQFLKGTGRKYGLRIDRQIDQRRNIYHATRAAVDYFTFLKGEFGAWTLAAAAYNMGEEGLKTALLTQEVHDYYRLYLPLETQRYIPRILAAKMIMSDPARFGFALTPGDLYPPVNTALVEFSVAERTPLKLVAQSAGSYFKLIKDLNPEIRGAALEPGSYAIRLPPKGAAGFHQRLKINRAAWRATQGEQIYVVRAGDNLSAIARQFDVPLPALLLWNRIRPDKPIHPGDQLIIYPPKSDKGS